VEALRADLGAHGQQEQDGKNSCGGKIAKCIDIETASPPVSSRVVAAILMIQNIRVTSGTLLSTERAELFFVNGMMTSLECVSPKNSGVDSSKKCPERWHPQQCDAPHKGGMYEPGRGM
jgi:hypothetical protein